MCHVFTFFGLVKLQIYSIFLMTDFFFGQTLHRKRNVRKLIKERNTEEQRAPLNLDVHVKPGVLRLLTHTVILQQMNAWMVEIYFIMEENFQNILRHVVT